MEPAESSKLVQINTINSITFPLAPNFNSSFRMMQPSQRVHTLKLDKQRLTFKKIESLNLKHNET